MWKQSACLLMAGEQPDSFSVALRFFHPTNLQHFLCFFKLLLSPQSKNFWMVRCTGNMWIRSESRNFLLSGRIFNVSSACEQHFHSQVNLVIRNSSPYSEWETASVLRCLQPRSPCSAWKELCWLPLINQAISPGLFSVSWISFFQSEMGVLSTQLQSWRLGEYVCKSSFSFFTPSLLSRVGISESQLQLVLAPRWVLRSGKVEKK